MAGEPSVFSEVEERCRAEDGFVEDLVNFSQYVIVILELDILKNFVPVGSRSIPGW